MSNSDFNKRIPTFFIIGAAKSGTTSLYNYLRQHPEIYFASIKEPHFFDNDLSYSKGIKNYLNIYFKHAGVYKHKGEATAAYFHRPEKVISRIKKVYGDVEPKFILILRDPVKRAFSHYLHRVRIMEEKEHFVKALLLEKERLSKNLGDDWTGYFSDGLYAEQLTKWFEAFSESNFLILLNEDLKENPKLLLNQICDFLEIDKNIAFDVTAKSNTASTVRSKLLSNLLYEDLFVKKLFKLFTPQLFRKRIKEFFRKKNTAPLKKYPEMNNKAEVELRSRFNKDVIKLEHLINKDLSGWRHNSNSDRR